MKGPSRDDRAANRGAGPRSSSELDGREWLGRDGRRPTGRADGPQPLRASWDPTDNASDRVRPSQRPDRSAVRRRSRVGRFISTYGWRAYAVPFLVVITVLAVFDATSATDDARTAVQADASADTSGPGFGSLSTGTDGSDIIGAPPAGSGSVKPSTVSGVLPDGGVFPVTGAGTWHVVPGTSAQVGSGTSSVSTYTVEVENGMDTASFGGDQAVASLVDQTLANPKSWTGDRRFAFRRIDSGTPSFRISLSSQQTVRTDGECGQRIELETSCFNRTAGRVVLNVARWVRGAVSYQGDIGSYRQYLVNHEVGHAIGFRQPQPCASEGGLAPVMMQQTFGVASNDVAALDPQGAVPANGFTCRFNPWPFPRG